MKSTLLHAAGSVLLASALASSAVAQQYFPPRTPDYAAPTSPALTPQNGVANTGTDIIMTPKGQLQALVWDDASGNVTLSTVLTPASGGSQPYAFKLKTPSGYKVLSDPDVAMAFYNGQLYADVVYLASYASGATTYTRTFYDVYTWNGSNFDPASVLSRPLGVASVANLPGFSGPNPIPRRHSSPNIDANAAGEVGIVWQETSTETAQITILSPSYSATSNPPYPGGYTYIQEGLTFAESYVTPAHADGSQSRGCGDWRGALISQLQNYNPNPTPANNNAPVLFNQTVKPDVAVGMDNKFWVSYLVNAATMSEPTVPGEPSVSAGLNLVVRKVDFDCSVNVTYYSKSWTDGVTSAPPRLAASPDPGNPDDVEVVQAWSGGACVEGSGPRSYYEIHNWGRSNGDFRDTYTIVNQPLVANQNSFPASEPVVAFYPLRDGVKYAGDYVVDWTGVNYPKEGQEADIWSRTLEAGNLVYPDYSRVNDDRNAPHNQRTPSVAGRFSGVNEGIGHAFVSDLDATVRFRASSIRSGSTGLNRAAAPSTSTSKGGSFGASPNPFDADVTLHVRLQAGESVRKLQVTDLSGRVVDNVPLTSARVTATADNAALRSVDYTWTPGPMLQGGVYLLRLITDQRTETLPLSKQ